VIARMTGGSEGGVDGKRPFPSVLNPRDTAESTEIQPELLRDLNLDQAIAAMISHRERYDLLNFFRQPLKELDDIVSRQTVFRDLEDSGCLRCVQAFSHRIEEVRQQVDQSTKLRHPLQRKSLWLDAVDSYCGAILQFATDFGQIDPASLALRNFKEYFDGYAAGPDVQALLTDVKEIKKRLSEVSYCMAITGSRVTVTPFDGESDYVSEVRAVFSRFTPRDAQNFVTKRAGHLDMDHVEAQILDRVAAYFPDVFEQLNEFCQRNDDFIDPAITTFDREIQVYLAYLEYIDPLRQCGLPLCYPTMVDVDKEIRATEVFDIVLALKLIREGTPIVRNEFFLEDPERILVVTGPNQGGKTTFARAFGQLHYLASLGFPVPGTSARLSLPDQIFTHFAKPENIIKASGKLEEDIIRMRAILERATARSIIIINEIFTSTTLKDSLALGTSLVEALSALGVICVYVTFVDELSRLSPSTVSMVSNVYPDDPSRRTFEIRRQTADGLAHAMAIAQKYRVTYPQLQERLGL
jgi:DNA mismatch repair protein MutS